MLREVGTPLVLPNNGDFDTRHFLIGYPVLPPHPIGERSLGEGAVITVSSASYRYSPHITLAEPTAILTQSTRHDTADLLHQKALRVVTLEHAVAAGGAFSSRSSQCRLRR